MGLFSICLKMASEISATRLAIIILTLLASSLFLILPLVDEYLYGTYHLPFNKRLRKRGQLPIRKFYK